MTIQGFVSLIGAGPGDPGLITVKGYKRLQEADVVIYDYLANPELLEACRADAELIYVGKQAGRHTLSQDEINALLVEHGQAGKRVARLKGGDPYIFGRGGEEADVLQQAGIPWEVVPGITAGVAAPAYAGIPVTHRELASSVAFITGHEDPTKPETAINWRHLATAIDTLVFYMGVGNLPEIAEKLISNGRDAQTPVAVIRWGTKPEQEVVTGVLATIATTVATAGLKPPAITIVGDVVRMRERLRWFDNRPLQGKRIIVTRAREQASALSEQLRAAGAEPIEYPVIAFAPPEDWTPLDQALAKLDEYSWIIFTSVNGVRFMIERMKHFDMEPNLLHHHRIGAIGPATAAELEAVGLRATFVPTEFVAEAVIEQIGDVSGQRILLPRADIAREALATGLIAKGAQVDNVVAYRTVLGVDEEPRTKNLEPREEPRTKNLEPRTEQRTENKEQSLTLSPSPAATEAEARQGSGQGDAGGEGLASQPEHDSVVQLLRERQIDAVTFTSSSTVKNFFARLEQSGVTNDEARALLEPVTVAAIGPITANTAREFGLHIAIEAEKYTIDGLMSALIEAFGARQAAPQV
ncbi:MAG TPA: uroporphyrinogen-III C-methyltransferase [Herpetosiphonaceae bacterium]